MTVAELIEELKKHPAHRIVRVETGRDLGKAHRIELEECDGEEFLDICTADA